MWLNVMMSFLLKSSNETSPSRLVMALFDLSELYNRTFGIPSPEFSSITLMVCEFRLKKQIEKIIINKYLGKKFI